MNENDPSVKMDSATMMSMLDLGENAPPSDKLQASPNPQTTIQDVQQSDADAAKRSLNVPELNNDVPKSSHRCRKPFYWNKNAPEFVSRGASSSTLTSNSNSAPTKTNQLPPMQGPSTCLRSFSDGGLARNANQDINAGQSGYCFQGNLLQNTQTWSLRDMNTGPPLQVSWPNVYPWFAAGNKPSHLSNNRWRQDYTQPMAALPTEVQLIDPITGFWSLELQEWTRHWVTGLEHVRDGAKRKHEICEAGWNAAKWENSRINRHLAAARRRGDRAEDDVRAVRQEMEQANQDALADATVQKATIAKLEEEVAQLNVEKDQLAGVGGQTEAIDRLQKQVARLEEENEKLTRDEPTLGSKVERLEAQLKDANETNRTLEDALAKQAEEKKRGNQYPKPSSRLQPPPARKEPCTHEAEFAILREEKSDAQAETYRLRAEMGKLENAIMAVRLSASQTKFECNQSQENAAELEQDLREKLSFARTSIRQFNRANDTLRDQKSHLEAAAEASKEKREKELDDLETKHQLETGGLHDRIIHLEYGIHALSEDKRINDEDKRRLEHEINCLKREYEKKIKDPKENESHTQALKDENTRPKARGNRNKKRGKGQATQLAAPMLKDSIVQKQESAMFKELTLWGSKWEYV